MGEVKSRYRIQNNLETQTSKWFAVFTKYKCEKYVVESLRKKGIHAYVPLIEKTKQYTSRKKTYQIPLINCYVFVHITKEEYISVLETEYLLGFVKQGKDLIAIPHKEIEVLKRIVGASIDVFMEPIAVNIGQKVEVIRGNLTGIVGVLVEKKGKKEFLVELQNIAYEMRVNINPAFLRAVV